MLMHYRQYRDKCFLLNIAFNAVMLITIATIATKQYRIFYDKLKQYNNIFEYNLILDW